MWHYKQHRGLSHKTGNWMFLFKYLKTSCKKQNKKKKKSAYNKRTYWKRDYSFHCKDVEMKPRAVKHTNTYMHKEPAYITAGQLVPYYSQLTHSLLFSSIHCIQTHKTCPLRKITKNVIKNKKLWQQGEVHLQLKHWNLFL